MKVLFLQEQPEVLLRLNNPRDPNPGVGGTSYLTCQVAYELHQASAAQHNGLEIHLGCIGNGPTHFHGIPVVDLDQSAARFQWDVVICTGGHLDNLASGRLRIQQQRLIAWIHHPFDADKLRKARALGAEPLSIGKAQFLSNVLLTGNHHHIDNLFCAERIRKAAGWAKGLSLPPPKQPQPSQLRIGYMGALIPSKGFHQLAEQWEPIQRSLASLGINAILEVIGGSSLYQFNQGDTELPCDAAYAERLRHILGPEIHRSVHFHGTLAAERYRLMSQCDLAVVNPGGSGEAFPATILEWLSLGVPVISSERYGCGDAMRLLPSLTIQHPRQLIQAILQVAQQSNAQRQQLANDCAQIGSLFSSQQALIIQQWLLLLLNRSQPGLKIHEHLSGQAYRWLIQTYWASRIQGLKAGLNRARFKR